MSNVPSRQRRYSMSEFGRPDREAGRGNYLLKSGRGTVWRPTWGDGGTTVRILPVRNVDDPSTWEPYRFSSQPVDYGDWIRKYPVCRNMGDTDPVTFIAYDPADPSVTRDHLRATPGWILYHAIDRAVANGQEQQPGWGALLKGSANRGAALSPPTEVYLMQVFVMQHGSSVYSPPKGFGREDKTIVLELTRGTGEALMGELDRVRPDYNGPQDDWENMMVHGDPVSLRHGRFIQFYNLKRDPRRPRMSAAGWASGGGAAGSEDRVGFGLYIDQTFNGMSADLSAYEDVVAAKVQPWDDILHFPSIEEQAQLLADRFPPGVILYAWRDYPSWIPESVRRRAVNARTFPVASAPLADPVVGFGQSAAPAVGWVAPPTAPPAFAHDARPPVFPAAPAASAELASWASAALGEAPQTVAPAPGQSLPGRPGADGWSGPSVGMGHAGVAGRPDPALPQSVMPPANPAAPLPTPTVAAPGASPTPAPAPSTASPTAVNWGQPWPGAPAAAPGAATTPAPATSTAAPTAAPTTPASSPAADGGILPPESAAGSPPNPAAAALERARRIAGRS